MRNIVEHVALIYLGITFPNIDRMLKIHRAPVLASCRSRMSYVEPAGLRRLHKHQSGENVTV